MRQAILHTVLSSAESDQAVKFSPRSFFIVLGVVYEIVVSAQIRARVTCNAADRSARASAACVAVH